MIFHINFEYAILEGIHRKIASYFLFNYTSQLYHMES